MRKWMLLPASTALALGVSFLLFVFMANLIGKPTRVTDSPIGLKLDINTEFPTLKPAQPDDVRKLKPKPQTTPPPKVEPIEINIKDDLPPTTLPGFEAPTLAVTNGTLFSGNGVNSALSKPSQGMTDGDAMPIARVEPLYPPDAARRGIEGWVTMRFDIDTSGAVVNVEVLDSKPARTFDQAAKKALKRWRYKAKFVGGEPVVQHDLSVRLDFALER